ncbi:MAG: hypothetical protein ACREME_09865 [Gemmatimonadales bacterium]
MRATSFAPVVLAVLVACQEPDSRIGHVIVQWMDWPAEVPASQPFAVRMIVTQPCAATGFREGSSADQSAVTFEPYFLDVSEEVLCARLQTFRIAIGALDTVGRAPGLRAEFTRTYEMRAAASVAVPQPGSLVGLPVRTFGDVTAIGGGLYVLDPSRRNAGGFASVARDTLDCIRIRPLWAFPPEDDVPLDDQGVSPSATGFMRGQYYEADAPVCGETRVFHLVSVN